MCTTAPKRFWLRTQWSWPKALCQENWMQALLLALATYTLSHLLSWCPFPSSSLDSVPFGPDIQPLAVSGPAPQLAHTGPGRLKELIPLLARNFQSLLEGLKAYLLKLRRMDFRLWKSILSKWISQDQDVGTSKKKQTRNIKAPRNHRLKSASLDCELHVCLVQPHSPVLSAPGIEQVLSNWLAKKFIWFFFIFYIRWP